MRTASALATLVAAGFLGLMVSSAGAGAAPIVSHFHNTFSDSNPGDNQCGIDGSSVVHGMINVQIFADGSKAEVTFTYVFTSAATGKSFEISAAAEETGAGPIDNGDGTVSFVSTFKGLPEKLKIPNGPILLRDAGNVTIYQTFDSTTGDLISQVISPENGPHPDLDSGGAAFCDVIVPALT